MILYSHAKKIVDEDPKQTGLFLGTGSTKTRIALFLSRGKTLVICPKTQREDRNWEREVQKIQKEEKKFHIDLEVMSKETFKSMCKAGFRKRYETIIVDEAHTCLGVTPNVRYVKKQAIPKTSQIFEELSRFIEDTKPERLYLATATIMKSPMTIWGAAKLLGADWNFYEFRNAFYIKLPMPGREVWVPRRDAESKDRLAKAVQKIGYTGRLSDYFDVPEQNYKVIHLELGLKQKEGIKQARSDFPDPLVQVGKRHQIENGVLSGDEFNKALNFESQKIDTLLDLSFEFPRMIIFAKYIAQIDAIAKAFEKEKKKVFVLKGDTKDRGKLIAEANACDDYVFIAQAQISTGWELPDCPVMVFASLSYSMVDRIQAEGRILRANKLKKNLFIDLVVRGGVDQAVYECIQNKKDFDERLYVKQESLL